MTLITSFEDVVPDQWVGACLAQAQEGLNVVDWLTASDETNGLCVVAHLVKPGTGDHIFLRCYLGTDARLPSLASHFPGVRWHERETAEMFGITFDGEVQRSLLLREREDRPPLRKTSVLNHRVQTPWPGAVEGDGRRRRKLPPGVRAEWIDDD